MKREPPGSAGGTGSFSRSCGIDLLIASSQILELGTCPGSCSDSGSGTGSGIYI